MYMKHIVLDEIRVKQGAPSESRYSPHRGQEVNQLLALEHWTKSLRSSQRFGQFGNLIRSLLVVCQSSQNGHHTHKALPFGFRLCRQHVVAADQKADLM